MTDIRERVLTDLMNSVMDDIQDMEERVPAKPDLMCSMVAGLALARTLKRYGTWRFIRTIIGAIIIRVRTPEVI